MSMRHKRRLASEINVVPYIDVMLVLLVIFMITAPLLTTGVEVELPQAQADVVDTEQQTPLVLSVQKDGQLFLNVGGEAQKPMQPEQVRKTTKMVLKKHPDTQVLVRGDQQSSYDAVVQAMVLLQQAGAKKVGLVTEHLDTSDIPL